MGADFVRVRFAYSKRRGACFIPHAELPTLFARAMRRAGLTLELTQGFSPHPKITLGPPLPVGVVGLFEVAEARVSADTLGSFEGVGGHLPQGFGIGPHAPVEGPSPALSKLCSAGEYLIGLAGDGPLEAIPEALGAWDGAHLLRGLDVQGGMVRFFMLEPDSVGPSAVVKHLISMGVASAWSDLVFVRVRLGGWDESRGFLDLLPYDSPWEV
ncbi:conserved hypothetical protein [Thermanaerovibrio acidaminovorans DSM 6589]|uniref:DUF2344 domain-containing protein n=1 Tax=Thermanaerovibrio acidaminovorans (strain ATCC 49978 / DSM 6589 / Su883) TaxID=525903 RepID=D1B5Z2_THEAS|nr:TIGR03936 family radical SAM-associated protein [Thermanaerovibrio acidaminovorans]ACZ19433.1 conserved hypothetical protein [Thermanaerovibrio acidaminovorans DSM 6589]